MKIFSFNEFINESLQDTVYHYTSLNNILSILKSNKINLSTSLESGMDNLHDQLYFLSVTRTRNPHDGFGEGRFMRFVLDGKKLNSNYKSKPIDFFKKRDFKKSANLKTHRQFSETEERILSDSPVMYNFNKYVKSIEIFSTDFTVNSLNLLRELHDVAEKNNISVVFYKDKNDYLKNTPTDIFPEAKDKNYEPIEYRDSAYLDVHIYKVLFLYLLLYVLPNGRDLKNVNITDLNDLRESINEIILKHDSDNIDQYMVDNNLKEFLKLKMTNNVSSEMNNFFSYSYIKDLKNSKLFNDYLTTYNKYIKYLTSKYDTTLRYSIYTRKLLNND